MHPNPTSFFTDLNKLKNFVSHGKNKYTNLKRIITSVEYIGKKETRCILIDDEDHLYITDDCIVTHNTILNAAVVDRYHSTHNIKTLTIVPSTSLIVQTAKQFAILNLETGMFDGTNKDFNQPHIISTWQTLKNYPQLVSQFKLVIIDECHGAQAPTLNQLLIKYGAKVPIRVGFTGTLPKHATTHMSIRIALGDVIYTMPAHTLIASGWLATPEIEVMQLDDVGYLRATTDNNIDFDKIEYDQHLKILQLNEHRLNWIKDFIIEKNVNTHKGNILCLVGNVKYGKKLQKLIPGSIFLYGKDKQGVRESVYELFENNDNLTVICTQQIAGVGLSIDRIFNLILIDMGKSYVKVIQMIGRGLRKGRDKDSVSITDICSNMPFALKHLKQREQYYKEAKYPYKIFTKSYQ
jgi:superfamily II DNA or RNA helicase